MGHRYYNYIYAINDAKEIFDSVEVRGWPFKRLGTVNLLLYLQATNES